MRKRNAGPGAMKAKSRPAYEWIESSLELAAGKDRQDAPLMINGGFHALFLIRGASKLLQCIT